jgi:rubredoxin
MASPEKTYQCQMSNCGFLYDPDRGNKRTKIPPGTDFADLPEDWHCPLCGSGKKMFRCLKDQGAGS